MSKLINIDSNSTTYRDMVAEVLPRGPIWDLSNPGVEGVAGGLGVEAVRFHRRLYDLMLEAYPSTADELLAEWEEVFGLPLCTEPDTDDGRRVALAGRVAAQGGQSRAYYIDLAWSVLEADGEFSRADDPNGVWIEEEPYGSPFEAWGGSAWDLLGGSGARHYWTMHLPSAVDATKRAIIECLLCKYKPAHTVLLRLNDLRHYYSTPGGASDYAAASTNVAARILFPGGPIGTFTVLMWVKQDTGAGIDLWSCGTSGADIVSAFADGARTDQVVDLLDGGVSVDAFMLSLPDSDARVCYAVTCDGSTLRGYSSGALDSSGSAAGTYTAQDAFVLFARGGTVPVVAGGETGSLRNIAIFDRALTADEIAALYDAGEHHNYANRHGADWAGETPTVYWRAKPVAGAVPNSGSGGVCALTLGGDVTATEEEAEITCETPGEPSDDYPAVTACYVATGDAGDYAEVADFDILFDGSGVEALTISMWINLTTIEGERVALFEASDDGTPTLFALTHSSSGIVTVMRDDDWSAGEGSVGPITNPLGDEEWHHVVVTSRHEGNIGHHGWLDGVDDDGSGSDGSDFATVASTLSFFRRWDGNNYHGGVMKIANIAVFGEILTDSEIEGLASAGVSHDVRNAFGAYPAKTPVVYYRDADAAGVVANIGSGAVGGLSLEGAVTSGVI